MQNTRTRFIGCVVVLVTSVSLAACSSGGSKPVAKAPVTASTKVQPKAPTKAKPSVTATANPSACPSPELTASASAEKPAALKYLLSPQRVSRFTTVVPKAGALIARALEDGRFGPVNRYDAAKTPLQRGEVGYGGIQSTNKRAFAWVYYTADGTIDFTKPVMQIQLKNANNNPATEVSMFSPTEPLSFGSGEIGTYWQIFKSLSDKTTEVTDLSNFESHTFPCGKQEFIYPYTLAELKALDNEGFDQLDANMTSLFGAGWDN